MSVNRVLYVLFFCSLLLSFMTSCKKNVQERLENAPNELSSKQKGDFKMYEMSEMAALMEQMYVDNLRVKEAIMKKEHSFGAYPTLHNAILTVSLTDPCDRDAFFDSQARLFIEIEQQFYQNQQSASKENFNKIIDSCISCHEKKCGGPIVRIKKLYIP